MFKTFIFIYLCFSGFCQDVAKVSEAMGHIIGKNLDSLGLDFDLDAIVKGLKEESEGKSSPLNEDECIQAIATMQEEKISTTTHQTLEMADSVSNGDQIEDHSISTPNSSEHR